MSPLHTVLIFGVSSIGFLLAFLFIFKRKVAPCRFLLGTILVFGILFNLVLTPGMLPDEYAHIETAYRYSNLLLFKPYATETGGILERRADAPLERFSEFLVPQRKHYSQVLDEFHWFAAQEETELVDVPGRNVDAGIAAYLPAAVGLALGRILHLGTYPMLYLARLCNLLCYLLLLGLALRITPLKKTLFALLGSVPMILQMACSFAYDMPTIGLCFLMTAYLLRLIYGNESLGWKHWLTLCVFSFFTVPCKLVGLSVLVLLLFLPSEKAGGRGKKALLIFTVVFCGLIGFVLSYLSTFTKYLSGMETMASDADNPLGVELYTLGWVFSHPKDSLQIFLHTIRHFFNFYWENMLGGRLSVFEPTVNWCLFLLIVLVLAAMKDPDDQIQLSIKCRFWCFASFAAVFCSTLFSMLFMYTPFGSEVILGVQGRYFLPALPLLFLAIGSENIRLTQKSKQWFAVASATVNSAALIEIFLWVLSR